MPTCGKCLVQELNLLLALIATRSQTDSQIGFAGTGEDLAEWSVWIAAGDIEHVGEDLRAGSSQASLEEVAGGGVEVGGWDGVIPFFAEEGGSVAIYVRCGDTGQRGIGGECDSEEDDAEGVEERDMHGGEFVVFFGFVGRVVWRDWADGLWR